MFLLTFVLLIISMLGIYTQVYALETARLIAGQTGLAQTVLTWHVAAASLAANVVNPATTPMGIAGCRLSTSTWTNAGTNAPAPCGIGANVTSPSSPTATVMTANNVPNSYTFNGDVFPSLPTVSGPAFQWNSIAFQNNGYYVLTFVAPSAAPASPAGLISTASNPPTQLNVTESDLYRQLRLLGIPVYSFGYVSNGVLNAMPVALTGGVTSAPYAVPPSIPNGALAIISSPGQCNGC